MTTLDKRGERSFRVFVIELGPDAWPLRRADRPNVWVGITSVEPRERFEQHMRGARNQRGRLYSVDVRDHGVRLRPDLYAHLPSLYSAADAKVAERSLAERLSTIGYSVKGGH